MRTPNYSETAAYFERRAAKAATDRRRRHLGSVAKLYREKAGETGAGTEVQSGDTLATTRRERVAAMFRALGDPASIAKSHRGSDLSERIKP